MAEDIKPAGAAQSDGQATRNAGGRWRNNRKGRKDKSPTSSDPVIFEGRTEDLKGFVFDVCAGNGGLKYTKTRDELARYAGTFNKDVGPYIREAVMTLMMPTIERPRAPVPVVPGDGTGTVSIDPVDQAIFNEKIKNYVRKEELLVSVMKGFYDIVWGQVTDTLRGRLKGWEDYEKFSSSSDTIRLLTVIKSEMTGFKEKRYLAHSLHAMLETFIKCRQGKRSLTAYYEDFTNVIATADELGLEMCVHQPLTNQILQETGCVNPTDEDLKKATAQAKERFLATSFLLGANKDTFGMLIEDIQNEYMRNKSGTSKVGTYPTTVSEAYDYLENYQRSPKYFQKLLGQDQEKGSSFLATTNQATNADSAKTCNRCGKAGHTSVNCQSDWEEVMDYRKTEAYKEQNARFEARKTSNLISSSVSWDFGFLQNVTEFLPDGSAIRHSNLSTKGVVHGIPEDWILLDNQSTCDIFVNPSLLKNITEVNGHLSLSTQAGTTSTNLMGDLPGYHRRVWFHPEGIANILSLKNVSDRHHVWFNSADDNAFHVKGSDGDKIFTQSDEGLYYMDMSSVTNGKAFVTTVDDKKSSYTVRDYKRAEAARKLQVIVGRPELKDFVRYIDSNQILNSPFTRQDAITAQKIWGRDVGAIQGKTTSRKAPHVPSEVPQHIPFDVAAQCLDIVLCIDLMFVNNLPFLITISRKINFITAHVLPNRKAKSLLGALTETIGLYHKRGLRITTIHGDNEFEPLRTKLSSDLHCDLDICGEDDHVPEIERCIRTVKERTRCTYNSTPFTQYPPKMLSEMIFSSIFWLNSFPSSNGISSTISPRTIVTGCGPIDFNKHCQIEFGEYVQTHDSHTNDMSPRTTGAIALRPTGNANGGYYFYSLLTGRRLHRTRWTPLPMPADVIDRVHAFARRARVARGITFTDSRGAPFPDDDLDPDYDPADDDDRDDIPLDDFLLEATGVGNDPADDDTDNDADDGSDADDGNEDIIEERLIVDTAATDDHGDGNNEVVEMDNDDESDADGDHDFGDDAQLDEDMTEERLIVDTAATGDHGDTHDDVGTPGVHPEIPGVARTPGTHDDVGNPGVHPETPGVEKEPDDDQLAQQAREQATADMDTRSLRERRRRNFDHLKGRSNDGSLPTVARPTEFGANIQRKASFTQYNLKQGLRLFGERGKQAVLTELKQLHDRQVGVPIDPTTLSWEERKSTLRYLMFLKEKLNGDIKARGCADGRPQRDFMTKEETSSPTVSTEALFLSCGIDAHENRDVAVLDIPGAFMQAGIPENADATHVKLEGVMAETMTKINPKYSEYTVIENKKPVIYLRLDKALYGTVQAALLFWKNLTDTLKSWGFTLNKYDNCVANKTIKGHQCTILWHVDDLKVSHKSPKVVAQIIRKLQQRYGQELVDGKRANLTISRGKIHDYLGMKLDYSEPGTCKIDMQDYVNRIFDECDKDVQKSATTPASDHLFQLRENSPLLGNKPKERFHTLVAKLLFLAKRGRPDLLTAVSFLCTRVQSPTEDDQSKLRRALNYLWSTKELTLRLRINNMHIVKWLVDASFAVHPDMKSHTGGVMTMGNGAMFATSKKQSLNTRSSTEAELVAADDVLPQCLWTRYFLLEQGYDTKSIMYQDNQSAMKLETNGKLSSSKRTRHINVRFYFITDCVSQGSISIQYCPTDHMTGDYMTKPLQGSSFIGHRDRLLGLVPIDVNPGDHRSVLGADQNQRRNVTEKGIVNNSDRRIEEKPKSQKSTYADVVKKTVQFQMPPDKLGSNERP